MRPTQNPFEGYSVIKSSADQVAEMESLTPSELEVFDLQTLTKSSIPISDKPVKKTRKQKAKAVEPQPVSSVAQEIVEEEPIEELPKVVPSFETFSVSFITPYTEIDVDAYEVYRDEVVFSIITDINDKVKVRPKRGATLEVIHEGETIPIYASGVYIPLSFNNTILSLFFINNQDEQN